MYSEFPTIAPPIPSTKNILSTVRAYRASVRVIDTLAAENGSDRALGWLATCAHAEIKFASTFTAKDLDRLVRQARHGYDRLVVDGLRSTSTYADLCAMSMLSRVVWPAMQEAYRLANPDTENETEHAYGFARTMAQLTGEKFRVVALVFDLAGEVKRLESLRRHAFDTHRRQHSSMQPQERSQCEGRDRADFRRRTLYLHDELPGGRSVTTGYLGHMLDGKGEYETVACSPATVEQPVHESYDSRAEAAEGHARAVGRLVRKSQDTPWV